MYAWIWRHLPGNLTLRLCTAIVLVAGVIALLLFVIFPLVDPLLPFNNVTTTGG